MSADVNYLAILVSAIASMVIGFFWYSPMLFANTWMKLIGKKEEELRSGNNTTYVLAFVSALVLAYVLAHFIRYAEFGTQASGVMAGVQTGFWAWLGFVATTLWVQNSFEQKPTKLYWINVGYHFVEFLVIGAILGGWR